MRVISPIPPDPLASPQVKRVAGVQGDPSRRAVGDIAHGESVPVTQFDVKVIAVALDSLDPTRRAVGYLVVLAVMTANGVEQLLSSGAVPLPKTVRSAAAACPATNSAKAVYPSGKLLHCDSCRAPIP